MKYLNWFLSAQKSGQLNYFLRSTCVNGMLVGRYCSVVDSVLLFIAVFIDLATGYTHKQKLTNVDMMYSNLVSYSMVKPCGVIGSWLSSYTLKRNIQKLKRAAKAILANLKDTNLLIVKFRMLDLAGEDESRIEEPNYLDVSSFKYTNFVIDPL